MSEKETYTGILRANFDFETWENHWAIENDQKKEAFELEDIWHRFEDKRIKITIEVLEE